MHQRKRPNFHKPLALLLALALWLTMAAPALAAENAIASSIQLSKTEGTVSTTNSAGRSISLIKNLRLFSGYHVLTKADSYAWLNLDSAKLLKVDASSETEVRKSGKKLEVLLCSGNLFFNVTEPLDDDETLNIRTSTTLTGVRGTCGWVNVIDRQSTQVCILEGTVECVVSDAVSGESKSTTIRAGEVATFTVHPEEASALEGERCEIVTERCAVEDVPGYVLVELAEDEALCKDILDASGLDILADLSQNGDPAAEAQRRLEEEERENANRLASIAAQEQAQANNVESAPYTPSTPSTPSTPDTPATPSPAPSDLRMVGSWGWKYDASTKTLHIGGSGDMSHYNPIARPPATTLDPPWYDHHQEIESIVIYEGITGIGRFAFYGCTNLTSVTIPEGVTSIGGLAFNHCTSLTSVTLPDSVTTLEGNVFEMCYSLKSVTIPANLTSIGYNAFRECNSLTDVYFRGSESQWRALRFPSGNSKLTRAAIHYNSR